MTKREFVKNAIAHIKSDYTPSFIRLDGYGMQKFTKPLYERYRTPCAERLLRAGVVSEYEAAKLSIGNDIFEIDFPWWTWYELPEEYSLPDAPSFLPKTIGYGIGYNDMLEKIRIMKEETGCYLLVTVYVSHFEKANDARGIENFLADMAGEPEYAQSLLDFIIHKNIVMLENFVNMSGVDGILLGSDWGTQRGLIMSPETWRRMIKPGEQLEYDLIKNAGKDVWIHSCGNILPIVGDLADMGVKVLNPVQPECMDIEELNRQYGDRLTFWGGVSTQQTLPYGTPDEVRAETLRVAKLLGENGGYITAASQDIQPDVPLENIISLVDTANSLKR